MTPHDPLDSAINDAASRLTSAKPSDALRANVALLRVREGTRIFKRDALPFAGALGEDTYDVAFADPPYESRMLDRVIDAWHARRFSRVLAVEHRILPAAVRAWCEGRLVIADGRVRVNGEPRVDAALEVPQC